MAQGSIYFLRRSDGLIKIGYTARLNERIAALTKSHGALEIIRVINGDRHREKRIHTAFASHNQFGEWFRDTPGLRREIDQIPDGTVVELAANDQEREWLAGEAALVAEAKTIIESLIRTRGAWQGLRGGQAMKAIAAEYGMREWLLRNILYGRATTVSALTIDVLRKAHPVELLKCRDHLLKLVESAEAARLEAATGTEKDT